MIRKIKNSLIIGCLLIAGTGSLTYWYYSSVNARCQGIQLYKQTRDRQALIKLFKDNWYWLVPDTSTFSAEIFLDQNKKLTGTNKDDNKIVVYCVNNKPIAMVAYYQDSYYKGQLRFIVVDKEYRGQGYSQKLMQYALDDMKKRGLSKVKLLTRTNNEPARKLYLSLGFKALPPKDNYIEFEKDF